MLRPFCSFTINLSLEWSCHAEPSLDAPLDYLRHFIVSHFPWLNGPRWSSLICGYLDGAEMPFLRDEICSSWIVHQEILTMTMWAQWATAPHSVSSAQSSSSSLSSTTFLWLCLWPMPAMACLLSQLASTSSTIALSDFGSLSIESTSSFASHIAIKWRPKIPWICFFAPINWRNRRR